MQVRIVHSVGIEIPAQSAGMAGANPGSIKIYWSQIIRSLGDKNLKTKLAALSAEQTLPASVKIVAATVGDSISYRDMCHVTVQVGGSASIQALSGEAAHPP